jgi:hypothetical protein
MKAWTRRNKSGVNLCKDLNLSETLTSWDFGIEPLSQKEITDCERGDGVSIVGNEVRQTGRRTERISVFDYVKNPEGRMDLKTETPSPWAWERWRTYGPADELVQFRGVTKVDRHRDLKRKKRYQEARTGTNEKQTNSRNLTERRQLRVGSIQI